MKKIFSLPFAIILLTPVFIYAQYSKQDYDLVKTTFDKKYDSKIISAYLNSGKSEKINAALLSIAQSEDTSFISEILKLNFNTNAEFICFALGQLGPDELSSKYLLTKLTDESVTEKQQKYVLQAIGKTGDSSSLELMAKEYLKDNSENYNGISISIFDFYSRRIIDKDNFVSILKNELADKEFPAARRRDAAFAIYRTNLSNEFRLLTADILKEKIDSNSVLEDEVTFKQYLFEILRFAKYFPDNESLFQSSLTLKKPLLRIQASKALPYFNYSSEQQVNDYLQLIQDENPVVSRQAAISIGEMNVPGNLRNIFVGEISKYLDSSKLTSNAKGELFLNYLKFNPLLFENILKNFRDKIEPDFIYRASGQYTNEKSAFDFLVEEYKVKSNKERMSILQEFLKFQASFPLSIKLNEIIFDALSSDSPALISIAADGVDSLFISVNIDKLSSLCKVQVGNYLNNPEFGESLISLYNLSDKISKVLSEEFINQFRFSEIYSVRQFANSKLNLPRETKIQNNQLLDSIWVNAFRYRSAIVNTIKGSFKINFSPEFAPVSVGNFCYLASQKYFNKIIFHRVVPGFVIQSGDSSSTGWGGPGYEIISEFSPLHYSISAVGMASAGKDTEGSQWFVTTGDFPHLDRRYTIFGYVTMGMDVVNKIDQGDEIISVELIY